MWAKPAGSPRGGAAGALRGYFAHATPEGLSSGQRAEAADYAWMPTERRPRCRAEAGPVRLIFADAAWEDCLYWQQHDKRMVERINKLIRSTMREPYSGIGKPEPLKHALSGFWSRRITDEYRMVYESKAMRLKSPNCGFTTEMPDVCAPVGWGSCRHHNRAHRILQV